MRILVLSDLHVGAAARAKDLCPYPIGASKDDQMTTSFIDVCKTYIVDQGKFDFLLIPGDITNQSNLIEYYSAEKFIISICQELNIPNDKVIVVPGNHDVDWSVVEGLKMQDEEKVYRKKYKYNTLADESHFFSKLSCPELVVSPYFKIWEYSDVIFVGYNSSWHDDSSLPKHYGLIEIAHIEQLGQSLKKLGMTEKLKIFVIHHHVFLYPNPHPSWIDISALQNSQLLLETLSSFSFNFIIHGHRHVPNFLSTTINNFDEINLLCAGSYSCQVHPDIAGSVGNMFHIIEFDNIAKCKGQVLTKAYHSTEFKWINSKENYGILHKNPFGSELSYEDLYHLCKEKSMDILQTKEMVKLEQLFCAIPDLSYSHVSTQKKIIENLENTLGLKSSTFGENEVILIKK